MHLVRHGLRTAAALAVGAVAVLVGCGSTSPTTTFTDDGGDRVTVDWADYPGHARIAAEEALAAPSQGQAEQLGADLLADIEEAVSARYGLEWQTRTEATWSSRIGNGYGGSSAYVTYNSASRETDDVPTDPGDWRDVVDVVSTVTEEHGLGPVVLVHEMLDRRGDDEALRSMLQESGASDPAGLWVWSGTADLGTQWLIVSLTDAHRHPDPAKVEEHEDIGVPTRSIGLTYGVTTIADSERSTFASRLEPFDGLDKPESTESD